MADYIEKAKLLQRFAEYSDSWVVINSFPLADVFPVRHAHWIRNHIGNGWDDWDEIMCSSCGYYNQRPDFPLDGYCPHCGARMDEKEDTNE